MIELGPTAAALSVASTTPLSLLLPPGVVIDPKIVTAARISGCAVDVSLTPTEIANLSRLNWHATTPQRAENDGVRSVHSPASRRQVPNAYAEVDTGTVADEITMLRQDFGFDWKAWLIFGLAGTAATTATSYLAVSSPIESPERPVIIAAGGITSSALALASGIFGLKAIYEYIEVSKLEVAADRR